MTEEPAVFLMARLCCVNALFHEIIQTYTSITHESPILLPCLVAFVEESANIIDHEGQ